MQKSQLGIELCDDFPGTSHMNRGHLHGSHGPIKTFVRRIFDQASDQAVTKLGVQGKNPKVECEEINENQCISSILQNISVRNGTLRRPSRHSSHE